MKLIIYIIGAILIFQIILANPIHNELKKITLSHKENKIQINSYKNPIKPNEIPIQTHNSIQESELINYRDQAAWPAISCKGQRNSPIDFPANLKYDTSNSFEILSTNYPKINGLKMEIKNEEVHHIAIPANFGELFVRKNGIKYRYFLKDAHFHIKSEHTFNGRHFDSELHMVHQKDLDYLAKNNIIQPKDEAVNQFLVVGTLFVANGLRDNPDFEYFGISSGSPQTINNLDLGKFSRPDQSYYHYIGGLTTPNCDEIVNWVVNTKPVTISKRQIDGLTKWISKLYPLPYGKSRKVQKLNGRIIYRHDHNSRNIRHN
jgi:carbonic anhydrase